MYNVAISAVVLLFAKHAILCYEFQVATLLLLTVVSIRTNCILRIVLPAIMYMQMYMA